MRVSIIGLPGSGTTTQALLLAQHLKVPYVSVGRTLRAIGIVNPRVCGQIQSGLPVDAPIVQAVMKEIFHKGAYPYGFVLDNFPRSTHQAILLGDMLDHPLDRVIRIVLNSQRCYDRIYRAKTGRVEDSGASLEIRTSATSLANVVSFYEKRGLLEKVDGGYSIPKLEIEIRERVGTIKPVQVGNEDA